MFVKDYYKKFLSKYVGVGIYPIINQLGKTIQLEYNYNNIYVIIDFFEDKYDVGATKGVLYLKEDSTKVIKIPLSHYENEVYIEDEGWEYRCIWLNGAGYGNTWNYCGAECDIYREAKKLGLEKYFLSSSIFTQVSSFSIQVTFNDSLSILCFSI